MIDRIERTEQPTATPRDGAAIASAEKIDEDETADIAWTRSSVPIEADVIRESVVTIDTTDKRSGFRAGGATDFSQPRNTYAAKKTVAQGMMDIALITANANQLRYLIEFQRGSPTFFVCVFLIIVSLLLQIAVGVSLIFKGRFDIKGKGKSPQARKINNYVVAAVFLITIINVFIASFSVTGTSATVTRS